MPIITLGASATALGSLLLPRLGVLRIIAGAAMSFSSVSVIGNALRLRRIKL